MKNLGHTYHTISDLYLVGEYFCDVCVWEVNSFEYSWGLRSRKFVRKSAVAVQYWPDTKAFVAIIKWEDLYEYGVIDKVEIRVLKHLPALKESLLKLNVFIHIWSTSIVLLYTIDTFDLVWFTLDY